VFLLDPRIFRTLGGVLRILSTLVGDDAVFFLVFSLITLLAFPTYYFYCGGTFPFPPTSWASLPLRITLHFCRAPRSPLFSIFPPRQCCSLFDSSLPVPAPFCPS